MAAYSTLDWQITDRVLTLTLNRPEQLNAFTTEMAEELIAAYTRASDDDAVGAVVVTGAGRAFCAGMDLSVGGNVFGLDETLDPGLAELEARWDDPDIRQRVRDTGGRVSLAVFECKKPIIAAINGAAVGIGATMTLPMDIRLASDKARIGFVFGRIGIVPEACSSWFLPRLVGPQQALEWVYSADILTPEQALAGRLLKAVVPHEQLLDEAHRLAHRFIDGRSAVSIALMRQMMLRNAALPHPRDAHAIESLAMLHTSRHDGREGVASFNEKRAPQYRQQASSDMPGFYPWW
ncbi:crotonase/enoyl-CoA hydratase family protein [Aquabacterium sp. OR-4]|uniref:crotonase/enoyl-CoA hydratase family protein n=1 Tax=Aquabacterium sp. OR-4 TaxID=2978127 RepID=UPI0021B2094E|nr:crotonase/enoyl-CoA hydratase family protein [Aquabacterium sp. OR-4]MDT7837545.1 crotonase/enoyl-CoA hydratase family protein [Aquabacterium sp. OR-4]